MAMIGGFNAQAFQAQAAFTQFNPGVGTFPSPYGASPVSPFSVQQMFAQILQAFSQLSQQWGGALGQQQPQQHNYPQPHAVGGNYGSAGAVGGNYGSAGSGGYQAPPAGGYAPPKTNVAVAVNVTPPPAPKGGGGGAYG